MGDEGPRYGAPGDAGPQTFSGGCHCGAVRFCVTGDLRTVTECNCSICTQKGFLHLIVPAQHFQLTSGRDALATYTFNTAVARHTFCRVCGIHPFYVPRSDPDKIDVNVRCIDDVDPRQVAAALFDGRNWEQAIGESLSWR
ncbi:MAG TPA: GFA family protein [Polyangia bacterium]